MTICGYDWASKFLRDYNRMRQSSLGKKMMGMIFRTDTFDYLSSKEAIALSRLSVTTSRWYRLERFAAY